MKQLPWNVLEVGKENDKHGELQGQKEYAIVLGKDIYTYSNRHTKDVKGANCVGRTKRKASSKMTVCESHQGSIFYFLFM